MTDETESLGVRPSLADVFIGVVISVGYHQGWWGFEASMLAIGLLIMFGVSAIERHINKEAEGEDDGGNGGGV